MSSFSKALFLFTATVATSVAGQNMRPTAGNVSSCNDAIAALTSNKDASQCLGLSQLSQVFAIDPQASVVNAVDAWLGAMCSAKPCSTGTTSKVAKSSKALKGCSLLPVGDDDYVFNYGNQLCLKDLSTNSLCTTQFLKNYEAMFGVVTSAQLQAVLNTDLVTLPSTLICTNCTKALFNYQVNFLDVPKINAYISNMSSACGATSIDEKETPTIFNVQPDLNQ